MDLDAILRRVQKLLAIAQDSRGDPNETAAAAAQAEKIMRKFNLDHAEVLAASLRRDASAAMDSVRVKASMKRDDPKRTLLTKPPKWASWLCFEVAMLYEVQVRYAWDRDMGGMVVEFCGVKSDVQVAGWTFDYLVGQMIAAVRAFGERHRADFARAPDKTASDSYRKGFVMAMVRSLQDSRKGKQAELESHSAGRALVVAKDAAVQAHFGAFAYGEAKRPATISDTDAFRSGKADGARVDVARRAVGGADSSQLKLGRD
jgi:hypothetical protein